MMMPYGIEFPPIHHEKFKPFLEPIMQFVDNREITDSRTNIALET